MPDDEKNPMPDTIDALNACAGELAAGLDYTAVMKTLQTRLKEIVATSTA